MFDFVTFFIKLSKYGLIISWAVPGQGGHQHINERPNQEIVQVQNIRSDKSSFLLVEWVAVYVRNHIRRFIQSQLVLQEILII